MLDAAEDRETPVEVLRELAESVYPFVRSAVARSLKADAEMLRVLVPAAIENGPDADIATSLASNPHTPADVLGSVARLCMPHLGEPREAPWSFRLGVLLCCHPATTEDDALALLSAPGATTQFRKVTARESTRDDVRRHLATDRSEVVRRALLRSH